MNKIPKVKKIPTTRKYLKAGTLTKTGRVRSTKIARNAIRKDIKEGKYKSKYNKRTKDTKKLLLTKKQLYKKHGVDVFPGKIKGSPNYPDGTPGWFVQQTKGMKGKHFIERGIDDALDAFENM